MLWNELYQSANFCNFKYCHLVFCKTNHNILWLRSAQYKVVFLLLMTFCANNHFKREKWFMPINVPNGVHGHINLDPVFSAHVCYVCAMLLCLCGSRSFLVKPDGSKTNNLIHNWCPYMSDPVVCRQCNIWKAVATYVLLTLMFGFMMLTNSPISTSHQK